MASMYVAEDMKPRLDLSNGLRQLLATQMLGRRMRFIQHAERRPVRHQDICIRGDHLPIPANRRAASDIECPIVEFGLNRRSPDFQIQQYCSRVLEVNPIAEQFSGGSRMALE